MQRIIIALALITVASAGFTATNYVVAPKVVVTDNETNFNNRTGAAPQLAVINAGQLSIVSLYTNRSALPDDKTKLSWTAFWKKLDNKDLSSSNNATLIYTQPDGSALGYGYAVSYYYNNDTTTKLATIQVYQIPLVGGGAALTPVQLNTPVNYTVTPVAIVAVGNKVYTFLNVADKKINLTSFTVGSATASAEVTVATTVDQGTFQAVWGEALGTNSALAYWAEGDARKDAVVDLTKGSNTPAAVNGFDKLYTTCKPFSTDKTYYGEYCYYVDANNTLKTYVKINQNTTGLVAWNTYNYTTTKIVAVEPYGQYLAVFFSNGSATATSSESRSFEIWDVLKVVAKVGDKDTSRKEYLVLTSDTAAANTRIPAGGIYTLVYTAGAGNATSLMYQNINAGLLLSGSYLTAILGFVMTIVAGLFLF